MKRTRANLKKQRPGWWTQDQVLARLQSGEYVGVICQAAADEMAEVGISLSLSRLRADITAWSDSLSYGEQFRAALAMWKKTSKGEMALSKDWHDDFIHAMETDACAGNAQKAAEMAGVGYNVVLAVLDRRNKCYDAEFSERFRIAELARVGRIREKYLEAAENGEGKAAERARERVIEAALPSLHSQRQEVHVSGKVEHDHEHQHQHLHGMAPGLAREIVMASQDRLRKLTAGRVNGSLPPDTRDTAMDEGRVIDVTPQRQGAAR